MKSNVFAPWLGNLQRPPGCLPKSKSEHQFYMGHHLYKEKVTWEYKKQYPLGTLVYDSLQVQCWIASDLLKEEPVEVREALRNEAVEELKVARERYNELKKGLPSDVPEDVEK